MIDLSLLSPQLAGKYLALCNNIESLDAAAVAFSSGVDSAFLLKVAHNVLGDRVLALTARSPSFPLRELEESISFCKDCGIRQIIVESGELQSDAFRLNPPNRCYLCKRELFTRFLDTAAANGIFTVL